MENNKAKQQSLPFRSSLDEQLEYLKLQEVAQNYAALATTAANKGWTHINYLTALMEQEVGAKKDRATQRRIRLARFPVIKTLDQFIWSWPDKINRPQVENLFHLNFIKDKANAIFLGGVGLGKTHLVTALAYKACLEGMTVLFTTAIDVVNALTVAQASGRFQLELKKYLKTELLVLDELGYLPIDKHGADLLFQVISHRYERGAMVISTNRAYKHWPEIFNNDATLTSAILDRLLHHAETVVIEGKSFRMKDVIDP
jgi:DNA replication protein DnaC